jgi:hypothetical protein
VGERGRDLSLRLAVHSEELALLDGLQINDNAEIVWAAFTGYQTEVFLATPDDGDGIAEEIDTLPDVHSNDFSDVGLEPPGTTSGTITNRGDQILTITEEANPSGVRIAADPSGGATSATVSVCGGLVTLTFGPGDEAIVTCGSAEIEVIAGPVEGVVGGEILITVPGGATATITELIEDTFQIENTGASGTITVEHDGEVTELNAGENTIITVTEPGGCAASTAASTPGTNPVHGAWQLAGHLACLLLPIGLVILFRVRRGKR